MLYQFLIMKKIGIIEFLFQLRRDWRAWAVTVTPAERRAAKADWIAAGRSEPRREKDGWRRFSFPHGYNSDLLEVLLLLGEAGAPRDETVERGLQRLLAARGRDGMWRMTGGLNGKMHADLDEAGKPSSWVTYRALLALKRFGALAWADGAAARPRPAATAS